MPYDISSFMGPEQPPSRVQAQAAALRGQPPRDYQAELAAAQAEFQAANAPLDRAPMEAYAKQRSQTGGTHLLAALAAAEAGPEFKPVQAMYLKQAAEANSPMAVTGGTLTPEGTFFADQGYEQQKKITQSQARLSQIERAMEQNTTRESAAALQREHAAQMAEAARLQREMLTANAAQASADRRAAAAQSSADRRYGVDQASADRAATAAAKAAELAANPKTSEGEKSAAGYLSRMVAVEPRLAEAPQSAHPGVLTKTLGLSSLGRVARPFVETADQQNYRALQEDWVRAKLRKESGAAIPTDEMDREIETYFTQPGESDPRVIATKAQARAQAVEQFRTMAGRAEPTLAPNAGGKAPPQIGEVRGGFTYKGGNPADPSSWSK